MKKIKFSLAVIIIFSILLLASNSYASSNYSWKEISKWTGSIHASTTAIKFEFESHYRNKYLSEDQFELYENIVYLKIYQLASTSNISIEKLTIISPSGCKRDINMIKDSGWHYKKMILYTSSYQDLNPENPLIFNETGIWTIEIQTNSSTSICKYKGAIWNFNEDSQVRNFFGNRIGIEVLSPTAVQQLATSIETKNLVEWQKLMVFVTAVMVCITAIAMAVNAITYKKVIKEIAKHLIKIEKIMEKLNKRGE